MEKVEQCRREGELSEGEFDPVTEATSSRWGRSGLSRWTPAEHVGSTSEHLFGGQQQRSEQQKKP
jgi:hypothetical protein